MPNNKVSENIERACEQGASELLRMANFYKRHDKLKQAAKLEQAVEKFRRAKNAA